MRATLVQEASQPECSVSLQACPEIPHAKVGKHIVPKTFKLF